MGAVPFAPLQLADAPSQFSALLLVSVPIFQMNQQSRMSLESLSGRVMETSHLLLLPVSWLGSCLFFSESPETKKSVSELGGLGHWAPKAGEPGMLVALKP